MKFWNCAEVKISNDCDGISPPTTSTTTTTTSTTTTTTSTTTATTGSPVTLVPTEKVSSSNSFILLL